jgi:hypothetical protein
MQINKLISQSKFDEVLGLYEAYGLTPEKVEDTIPSFINFYDPLEDSKKTNLSNSKQFMKLY